MPSPISTDGFSVRALPDVRFADPRLLAPNYGALLPSLGEGLRVAEDVRMSPMRINLAGIQLQEAQNRLAMAPLEQQLAALRLGEAQRKAAMPEILPGDITYEDTTKIFPAALDESGNRTGPDDVIRGDLIEVQSGTSYGSGGVATPYTRRKTIKTAEQRQVESEKQAVALDAARALASQRQRGKEFESATLIQLYNDAVDSGDAEAAALYKARIDKLNAPPGILPTGTAYQRRIEQLAADAGITLEAANRLAKTPDGAEALAQAAVANKAAARSPFGAPVVTSQQKELISGAGRPVGFEDEVSAAFAPRAPARNGAVKIFSTVADAEAAGAAGLLQPGEKINIAGRSATWQQ